MNNASNAARVGLLAAMICLLAAIIGIPLAAAGTLASIRGVVHDSQHRPISGAFVSLRAVASDFSQSVTTDDTGQFILNLAPIGEYLITVSKPGFAISSQPITLHLGAAPLLHFALAVAGANETVNVSDVADVIAADSATPSTLVSRGDVQRTPGADRTNSLAMIADYVPGAYVTHDQLHVRGGHQVSWLVDGVPVPNTNIASNVGPQFDPKDIDYLEVQRGSYSAEYGDRTYAAFNVVPRTGFERNNQAELITSFGNFYQTNDQINFGSHSERFAYYASLNGNRSDLGLETPAPEILHDRQNGYGGFSSLIWNVDASNQLRFITSLRRDYYQIPVTAAQQSARSSGDGQQEADAFANFSWVHTFNSQTLLTISPFYHYNRANYDGGPNDFPVVTLDHHSSEYSGGQAVFSAMLPRNSAQIGVYGFAQRDIQNFGLTFNDGSVPGFVERAPASGNLESLFVDDKFRAFPWLTITAGMRPSHFSGSLSETAISPRFGAALEVPRLHWTFRAFYGHYYQAPPLITVSGPLLDLAQANNSGFIPLRGERDEERQFGVNIPLHGWTIDLDNFKTSATNFFDHNNVGESDIFFPITISRAVIRGWETTLRSPMIARRGQIHLAYSNQIAEGALPVTGGLTNFSPPSPLFLLDHDQRNTLNVGGSISLPLHSFASTNVYYGSGFTDSGGPAHLPAHTTFDVSLGKDFAERLSLSANVLNAANRHLLTDNSLTFGGTHWNNPREIFVEVRYKFHY